MLPEATAARLQGPTFRTAAAAQFGGQAIRRLVATGLRLPADGGGTAVFEWGRTGARLADLKGRFKDAFDALPLSPAQEVVPQAAFRPTGRANPAAAGGRRARRGEGRLGLAKPGGGRGCGGGPAACLLRVGDGGGVQCVPVCVVRATRGRRGGRRGC